MNLTNLLDYSISIYGLNEIESQIKSLEVKKKVRQYKDNSETLLTYWTVGKLLIEAQGGEDRASMVMK